jgi:hypothetical protein
VILLAAMAAQGRIALAEEAVSTARISLGLVVDKAREIEAVLAETALVAPEART